MPIKTVNRPIRTGTMNKYTVEDLASDLCNLDLRSGDIVLVRAALRKLGDVEGNRAEVLIRALLEVVGVEGAILGLAFTTFVQFPERHPKYVVDSSTPLYSGGFAAALTAWPGAIRSSHPTNSWVGIGQAAEEILREHDEGKACFYPIKTLMDMSGKLALIGCVSDSPGFSTVHYAQLELGLSRKSIKSGKEGVYFRKNGQVRLFTRDDVPGCSRGFHRFYGDYVKRGILKTAFVGDAFSICADADRAYKIEYDILSKNPKYALCDDPLCSTCRASWFYNLGDMLPYYVRRGLVSPMMRVRKRALRVIRRVIGRGFSG